MSQPKSELASEQIKEVQKQERQIKSFFDFKCIPVVIYTNEFDEKKNEELAALLKDLNHIFFYNIKGKKSQADRLLEWWPDKMESLGWDKEQLYQLIFVHTLVKLPSFKKYVDYLYFSHISHKNYSFVKRGYSHFMWFNQEEDLDNIQKLLTVTAKNWRVGDKEIKLTKSIDRYEDFPSMASIVIPSYRLLDDAKITEDTKQEYNFILK